jgi:phosphinothricin acetyltransferase
MSDLVIRAATEADAAAVAHVYNHYVRETTITFEEEDVPVPEIARRIREVGSASLPWLIAERDAEVVGYAYAARWHARSAYRFSVEITAYIDARHQRSGVGSGLYDRLFPLLQARGIRAVMACIALPNEPSVVLHEKFGLVKVGHFKEVGFKFDRWIDVGYWQRTLSTVERGRGRGARAVSERRHRC